MSEARSCVEGSANNPGHWAEDVPAGYRRTEVGVIPKDWDTGPMASIADIYSGATPSTQNPANWNGSIRWCVPTDITSDTTKYLAETSRSITQKGLQSSGATLLPVGALLLCSRATIGEVKIAAISLCTNQGFKSLVCKDDAYNEFLYYLLLTLKPRLKEKAAGSTFLEIGKNDLASIQIALPSYSEQCAIAEALSDVDELLESLDALIAKKRAIKQATMQQLLTGTTRLPGFTEEWVTRPLSEVSSIRSGGTPSTENPKYWNGNLPWCTPTDITNLRDRKCLIRTVQNISDEGLHSSSAEVIPPQSLIMTSRATIGECAINLVPVTTSQGFKNIVTIDGIDIEFLYYLMTTQISNLIALCGGSTFLEIGKKQLESFMIALPKNLDEQQAIATTLSDMDAEITALEQRRDKIRIIKQGMMQQLLTGRVRLI